MKRSNLRRSFVLALLFALILPILAACGGGTTAAPTAAPAAPADAPTAAPAAPADAPTAAPAPEAPTAAAEAPTAAAEGGGTANAVPGVLRINNGAEGDNYDPQQASFLTEIRWILLNWQPLMSFDQEMKPIPGAAESVDVSADGKTYTFHLRPDSKYSNGDPLTAADWVRAWQRLGDPELAGEYQFIACDIIKGYSEYSASTCQGKSITETLALDLPKLREDLGVKAVDDNTLQVELVNPAPYFLSIAALWVSVPVREADAENVADLSQAVPESFIGNGPFKLVEHERDTKATWEVNTNYKGPFENPKLKGINMVLINESQVAFQAYKNGELDMLTLAAEDRAAVEADPVLSKELIDVPGQCTFYLGMHNKKAPFDNQKVRQAFAQAFDREAYVRDVLQGLGKPTQTFIPPGFPGYEATDQFAFNADAAKKALSDAGFANGQGLPEIKLTYSASARNKVRFEWVANQIKQNLGIDTVLDPVDPTAFTGLTKDIATTPQLFILGWCADFPDPQNWLTAVFKTGGSSSARLGYSNPEFDKLVSQADVEQDAAKRAELYSQAQKMLIEDAPVAFLWNDANKALVKPYVKGVKTIPLDFFPGFYVMNQISVEP
jgi:oligopeptide transport system substrate-binding protein